MLLFFEICRPICVSIHSLTHRVGLITAEIQFMSTQIFSIFQKQNYEIYCTYPFHIYQIMPLYMWILYEIPRGQIFPLFIVMFSYHQGILPKGRFFTANSGTQAAVLLGMDRCGSFQLLSTPHSLFNIWTDLKRSGKIPGAPAWKWWERIWLTGSSRLHRNSPQRLNISSIRVFDQIRDPEIPITLRPRYGIQ